MDCEEDPAPHLDRSNMAEGLREQAPSYRRLAAAARTRAGTRWLRDIADTFDDRARKLDPSAERP